MIDTEDLLHLASELQKVYNTIASIIRNKEELRKTKPISNHAIDKAYGISEDLRLLLDDFKFILLSIQ
jgi:hypothetical protein